MEAAGAGRGVAIHAVIAAAVELAIRAAARVPGVRIEHAAELPARLLALAREAGVRMVTHPGWVRERAAKYLVSVDPGILPGLHRGRSLLDAGIPVWFGSDAPASEPHPFGAIETAVTRRALDGTLLNGSESIAVSQAIAASIGGRVALDTDAPGGTLEIGAKADFIVVDRDPFELDPAGLSNCRVMATYVGGVEMWRR
jgi:predicted amidohydrolase YtcJ